MSNVRYEQDFFRWTEEQLRALRDAAARRSNAPLDWKNLAEEIESLGRSEHRELGRRIPVIVEHLVKLQASSAADPRADGGRPCGGSGRQFVACWRTAPACAAPWPT